MPKTFEDIQSARERFLWGGVLVILAIKIMNGSTEGYTSGVSIFAEWFGAAIAGLFWGYVVWLIWAKFQQ